MYCPKCGTDMKKDEFCRNCFFSFDMVKDPIDEEKQNLQAESLEEGNLNIDSVPNLDSGNFIDFDKGKEESEDNNKSSRVKNYSDRQDNMITYEEVGNKNNKNFKIVARLVKAIIFSLLAIYILFNFFKNADMVEKIGLSMKEIKSVGGRTLEEAFYNEKGNFYIALSELLRLTGIFFSAVLVALGLK